MSVVWLDRAIRNLGTTAISGYQRYVSPQKGFACAHRRLYGGISCSEYVKQAIAKQELAKVIQLARQRFQACKQANQIIRNQKTTRVETNDPNSQKKKSGNPQTQKHCGGLDLGCEAIECVACSGFDMLDCSSTDCSSVDCCSCWG